MDKLSRVLNQDEKTIMHVTREVCEQVISDQVNKDIGIGLVAKNLESEADYEEYKNARSGNTLNAIMTRLATEKFHTHSKRYNVWLEAVTFRKEKP